MLTEKLQFKQDKHYPHEAFGQKPKYGASVVDDKLMLSVVYGGGSYGSGPKSDQYEIALFDGDDMVQLDEYDTVQGWVPAETINHIVSVLEDNNINNKVARIQRILKRHD